MNYKNMVQFVNAKINIGLQIVRKREDGYHDLRTLFYPVGLYAGTPENPVEFCDMLEIISEEEQCLKEKNDCGVFRYTGRAIACEPEKNLIYKAYGAFCETTGDGLSDITISLEKHLPDGAGLGGGSADAAFTLKMLGDIHNRRYPERPVDELKLYEMALRLGADCPFFILNRPAYAEGVGERLEEIDLNLSGYTLLLVKPNIYVSTKEAFAGVKPAEPDFDLRNLSELPIEQWREVVKNDFEDSIFPCFPKIADIREKIYSCGALYASMTGSGSSVYGIFRDKTRAESALNEFNGKSTIEACYLLKL